MKWTATVYDINCKYVSEIEINSNDQPWATNYESVYEYMKKYIMDSYQYCIVIKHRRR